MQRPRQGLWSLADVLPCLLVAFTFNECLHRSSAQNITYRQAPCRYCPPSEKSSSNVGACCSLCMAGTIRPLD